ncbi:MAG: NAD-dependent epimerase/dehydratase family protein, partial [Gemmatimonas sp.]
GGKMGPTLARMARRALDETGVARTGRHARRVIAVSRFSNNAAAAQLERFGVETVRADLSDPAAFPQLPSARNVIWMVGQKFGTTGDPVGTWTHNVSAAAFGAEHCAGARVVCFSTGNVYPRGPLGRGGSQESATLSPDGEYAASCIGRERVFESAARRLRFKLLLYRLFYACDLRYGVVTDIAFKVMRGEQISLATPAVNVIWQGDANRLALRALTVATCPGVPLNVSGPIVTVRAIAERLAAALGTTANFDERENVSTSDALLANTLRVEELLPYESLSLDTLCEWAAEWVRMGNHTLAKPTRFDVRDGKY